MENFISKGSLTLFSVRGQHFVDYRRRHLNGKPILKSRQLGDIYFDLFGIKWLPVSIQEISLHTG